MIALHVIWSNASLFLWGEHVASAEAALEGNGSFSVPGSEANKVGGDDTNVVAWPMAVDAERLRRRMGDAFDALLVSSGTNQSITLQLPFVDGRPQGSTKRGATGSDEVEGVVTLRSCVVPGLAFAASDAVDLLASRRMMTSGALSFGASFRFWSKAAEVVLELLARQRFIPALHRLPGDRYCGYWRAVLNDPETLSRMETLIEAMPPVCYGGARAQPTELMDEFLRTTVDALVRRCLGSDELAHALLELEGPECSPPIRWLRSLVRMDPVVEGSAEEKRQVYETVTTWLSRVEPAVGARSFRTCFRLTPPSSEDDAGNGWWRLTLCIQTPSEPAAVREAQTLFDERERSPSVFRRLTEDVRAEFRADIARAARRFAPLRPCAEGAGPLSCDLTLEEAYAFLRDAAPILESEGFGVLTPSWWRQNRPRVRMWLHLRPVDAGGSVGATLLGLDALVSYDWRVAVGDDELALEELVRLSKSKAPLVNLRGRWTEVQAADAAAATEFLHGHTGGRMTLMEALRQCYSADDLETGVPVAGFRASGWIESILEGSACAVLESASPPQAFQGTLRPYQVRGLSWLAFMTRLGLGSCLADDMGLGKTIQLIALWLHERREGASPGPTLLIVPMSLVGNWQREIERFGPSLRVMVHHGLDRLTGRRFEEEAPGYDVVISTYGLIHRDFDHLSAIAWHRVALDEAQNIKNPAAKQATAVRGLRAINRLALTGTPIENRLSELWSIMDFLNPNFLSGASEFRRRFALPIERYHDDDRAERLRHLIRPFILRRLKSDPSIEVDLPEKMEMKVYCNLTREQAALYESAVGDMLGQIDRAGGIQRRGLILAALVRLKQICNHPAHFLGDGSILPRRSGKCDRLTEMLDEAISEGDRALVFTQFREMGDLLVRLLGDALGREILFLHGGTTRIRRDALVADFQEGGSNHPVLVLSLKAGGHGLNLTAATHVFHFDRWWNPAVEDQATDRTHRIGQTRRVQVHKFVCIGTLEERIDGLLEEKRALADNIVGAGEEWLTELSTDRLREIFALSRDAVAGD